MFDKVTKLLGLKARPLEKTANDLHLATAALLVYVSRADGDFSADERAQLLACMVEHFGMETADAGQILDDAEAQQQEATCLYRFTKAITDQLDQEGRQEIVRLLWRVAFADNHLDNFESNVLAKVSGLLGVTARDRVDLKHQVEAETG